MFGGETSPGEFQVTGSYLIVNATTTTRYYHFNGQRVAMRRDGMVYFLQGDHLGTTSLVLDDQGNRIAESRHYPYGGERWRWPAGGAFPTEYRFTGQRLDGLGLYQMGVRWYDSALGRWTSPDSIVPEPNEPQSLNRLSWVRGNPLRFVDPTGHVEEGACGYDGESCDEPDYLSDLAFWAWLEANGIYIDRTVDAWIEFCWLSFVLYNSPGGGDLWAQHTSDPDHYHPSTIAAEYWVKLNGAVWAGGALLVPPVMPLNWPAQSSVMGWSSYSWQEVARQIKGVGDLDTYWYSGMSLPALADNKAHGNSLDSPMPTWLYKLVDRDTGQVMKYGITNQPNPKWRYTQAWYREHNVDIVPLVQGQRWHMYQLEYQLNTNMNTPWSVHGH